MAGELIRDGDYVRVVSEGMWVNQPGAKPAYYGIQPGGDVFECEVDENTTMTIEKIEPPVVTYGPGQTVRSRTGKVYSVGQDGYFSHGSGNFYEWAPVGATPSDFFKSDTFEPVDLS